MNDRDHATTDELYALIRLVRPLYKTLEAAVATELEGTGVSVTQRAVLERLDDQGPQTVPDIGRHLAAPRQFIQRVVNELREAGLVETRANPAHARSVLVALTADGKDAIDRIKAREAEVMRQVAPAIAADDLAAAQRVIRAVIDGFGRTYVQEET